MNEGANLFVEEMRDESRWEREFELESTRLQVRFNIPSTALLDVQYKDYILCDKKVTVMDLKCLIAERLGKGLEKLVFRKGGTHGAELTQDELTLKQALFYN